MEPLSQTTVIAVQEPSQLAVVRRIATQYAGAAGLNDQRTSAFNVVVMELANNLLQHAGSGQLYMRFLEPLGSLEVVAVDHGRGMDVERCVEDGYSTASTPGLGLGAVQRFATDFAAYSSPGRTTAVGVRMTRLREQPNFSVVCRAIAGETLSGDSWSVSADGRSFLVVDGLGHGLLAADAAKAALAAFHQLGHATPQQMLEGMHLAMRSTRGAAGAIAQIDAASRTIQFAGIGNISCSIVSTGRVQNLVSHNGTLGHQMRRVQQFQYSYNAGDMLMMHSDGVSAQPKLAMPVGLLSQPPFLVAPFLFSEQVRERDDSTLLVNRLD